MRLSTIFVAQLIILYYLHDVWFSAREVYLHTHQIACAIDVQDLCKYIENNK